MNITHINEIYYCTAILIYCLWYDNCWLVQTLFFFVLIQLLINGFTCISSLILSSIIIYNIYIVDWVYWSRYIGVCRSFNDILTICYFYNCMRSITYFYIFMEVAFAMFLLSTLKYSLKEKWNKNYSFQSGKKLNTCFVFKLIIAFAIYIF